jgi:hypothetical protein
MLKHDNRKPDHDSPGLSLYIHTNRKEDHTSKHHARQGTRVNSAFQDSNGLFPSTIPREAALTDEITLRDSLMGQGLSKSSVALLIKRHIIFQKHFVLL